MWKNWPDGPSAGSVAKVTAVVVLPDGIVIVCPLVGALIEIVGVAAWTTVKVDVAVAEAMPPAALGAPLESTTVRV